MSNELTADKRLEACESSAQYAWYSGHDVGKDKGALQNASDVLRPTVNDPIPTVDLSKPIQLEARIKQFNAHHYFDYIAGTSTGG